MGYAMPEKKSWLEYSSSRGFAVATSAHRSSAPMTSRELRNIFAGLAFISPWLIGLTVFTAYPVFASLFYSFCDYSVLQSPVWSGTDRKSTRLNSSHSQISYAVFCLKKKKRRARDRSVAIHTLLLV